MKKIVLFVLVVTFKLSAFAYYDRPIDFDTKLYFLPSYNNHVSSLKNADPSMHFLEPSSINTFYISWLLETRGDIVSFDNYTLAGSFMLGLFGGLPKNNNSDFDDSNVMGLSLGIGIIGNRWSKEVLTGPSLFFYPLYNIPICSEGNRTCWNWQCALDLGYTFKLLTITVYPYYRTIFAWAKNNSKLAFDFGIAIGLYDRDKKR